MSFISRRELLRIASAGAASTLLPPHSLLDTPAEAAPVSTVSAQSVGMTSSRETLEQLTTAEAEILDAIVARLIPADEHGPGAREARAVRYIDRALGGALSSSKNAYTSGLAALDAYARATHGAPFTKLSGGDQDVVLTEVEKGTATGFTGNSAAFFTMVLGHTHQGTFGDPYYGGNANFVGWDLLGYPGVRTMVTSADQKALEEHRLTANHKSAYEYEAFTKASPRNHLPNNE